MTSPRGAARIDRVLETPAGLITRVVSGLADVDAARAGGKPAQ